MRGTHDAESHAPEKDKSNFLSVAQIDAIRTGVRMEPAQPETAKHWRRHLDHCSPPKRSGTLQLLQAVRRRV